MACPPGLSCSGGGGPFDGAASGSRLADSWGLLPKGAAFCRARGKERGAKDHRRRTARNGPVTREDSVRDTRQPGTEQVADELRAG